MPLDMAVDGDGDRDGSPRGDARQPAIDERELVAILRAEEIDASSYYTSELAKDQAFLIDRYFAKPYGDEVEGRSAVCTRDIQDTVNWMLPDLMRVFLQSDDLVTVHDHSGRDEDQLQVAADYLRHVFFSDNRGDRIIHDAAFDGLVQRIGVGSVRWEDPKPQPPQELEGVGLDALQRYLSDPEYEILEQEQSAQAIETPAGVQQMPVFKLRVQRTPRCGRVVIEVVPPEEFKISRRARSLEPGGYDYVAREQNNIYIADLIRLYPDKAGDLDPEWVPETAKEIELNADARVLARFDNEAISTNKETSNHTKRKKCDLRTEYIWIDYDNDGVVELRQIKRVGDVVLENERVDDCEFEPWSPVRIAHRLVGLGVADTIKDIQKLRTVITRRTLDSLDQSLLPRTMVDRTKMDPEDIDALLDAEVGAVIGTKGAPRDVALPLVTPDLTASGYQALEYWDAKSEQASGVTRHQQGLQPDTANKTATGIDLLQQAAGDRIELVARWLAQWLERVLGKALKLIIAHQDAPRQIKVNGQPIAADPRRWNDEMGVHVHVAMAASNRQTMLSNLMMIAAKQEQIILQAGPDNPLCGLDNYAHTLTRAVQTMGFRATEKFFKPIKGPLPPQPPKPDPKMAEVQQRGEIAKAELQHKQQATQADLTMRAQQGQAEMALKSQTAQRDAEAKAAIEVRKAEAEMMLGREKIQAEIQLAREKMFAELELRRQEMAIEAQIARERFEHDKERAAADHDLKRQQISAKTAVSDGVRVGGDVG